MIGCAVVLHEVMLHGCDVSMHSIGFLFYKRNEEWSPFAHKIRLLANIVFKIRTRSMLIPYENSLESHEEFDSNLYVRISPVRCIFANLLDLN